MNKKAITFCLFVLLIFINLIISMIAIEYIIKLINFIALEVFDKERFYVYDTKNAGFGMYMSFALNLSFCVILVFSIFCYWFYGKYRDSNIKVFIIIFIVFLGYFLIFSFICHSYRLSFFILHFISFICMYIEIVCLYLLIQNLHK